MVQVNPAFDFSHASQEDGAMTLYDSILYVERQLYQSTKSYKKDLSDVTVTKEFQTLEGRTYNAHKAHSCCAVLLAGLRWRCDAKLDT